jgi:SAM-dependent methyltransferase
VSHPNQLAFVDACVRLFETHAGVDAPHVAEIGSYDVNGSMRSRIAGAGRYIGVDLVAGPGVDVVMSGHHFGDTESFDLVMCSEVFEHNPFWLETFVNMIRIAKPGGCIVFTCATLGRFEHGTRRTTPEASPGTSARDWQYYRNLSARDFTSKLCLDYSFAFHRFFTITSSHDLYFVGTKKVGAYDAREPSWLMDHIGELDDLAARLQSEKEPRPTARHPVLAAIRDLPIAAAGRVLPDRAFQDFWTRYLRWTKRLVGRR